MILRMDDVGVPTYNELVIVAREADVRSRGPLLRRFMRALARGHDALRKNSDVGVDALVKANPDLKASLQRAQVKATLPVFFPTDKDKPFGFQDPQEWQRYAAWMAENKLIDDAERGPARVHERVPAGRGHLTPRSVSVAQARRLALHAQGLAAAPPRGAGRGPDAVAAVTERIGCLQLDPVSAVARSPLLVLFARLGPLRDEALEQAAYRDRALFDAWAHEASLVATADLPLHRWAMRTWLQAPTTRAERARAFLAANAAFADELVDELRERGPLRARDLEDRSAEPWRHGWWTDEVSGRQTIGRMLHLLWITGASASPAASAARSGCGTSSSAACRRAPAAAARRPRRRGRRARGGAARRADARRGARRARARALPAPPLRPAARDAGRARRRGPAGAGRRSRAARRVVRRRRGPRAPARPGAGHAHDRAVALRQPALRPGAQRASCSASTIASRSTSRRRSAAGATTCCRSCTASGSSRAPTCRWTARPACCACSRCTASPACAAAPALDRAVARALERLAAWRGASGVEDAAAGPVSAAASSIRPAAAARSFRPRGAVTGACSALDRRRLPARSPSPPPRRRRRRPGRVLFDHEGARLQRRCRRCRAGRRAARRRRRHGRVRQRLHESRPSRCAPTARRTRRTAAAGPRGSRAAGLLAPADPAPARRAPGHRRRARGGDQVPAAAPDARAPDAQRRAGPELRRRRHRAALELQGGAAALAPDGSFVVTGSVGEISRRSRHTPTRRRRSDGSCCG